MKFKIRILIVFAILNFGLLRLQAQETINTSGSDASGSGGVVTYSVGQAVYVTNTSSSGSVAQGVQQPFEISVVLGIDEVHINLSLTAYPNPTTDMLTLEISDFNSESLNYQFYDINGRVIDAKEITSEKTNIETSNIAPAIYFLKIAQKSNIIKIFKIIKK